MKHFPGAALAIFAVRRASSFPSVGLDSEMAKSKKTIKAQNACMSDRGYAFDGWLMTLIRNNLSSEPSKPLKSEAYNLIDVFVKRNETQQSKQVWEPCF